MQQPYSTVNLPLLDRGTLRDEISPAVARCPVSSFERASKYDISLKRLVDIRLQRTYSYLTIQIQHYYGGNKILTVIRCVLQIER